ncbi:MAG: hypothetical protein KAS90_02140 [Candidatus Aenigmarchaeota archaeon]|nr:hypothetical protein [Candidatus Aenigmarchaeota archaeon]
MNEKLKIIRFNSPSEIDSVIDELKEFDNESYGIIIDPLNDRFPTLFQGYFELKKKGYIYRLTDDVWESKEHKNDPRYDDNNMISLSPKKYFMDKSYSEHRNTSYIIYEDYLLVLGNKEDIEACYERQYTKVKKTRQIQKR